MSEPVSDPQSRLTRCFEEYNASALRLLEERNKLKAVLRRQSELESPVSSEGVSVSGMFTARDILKELVEAHASQLEVMRAQLVAVDGICEALAEIQAAMTSEAPTA